MNDYGPNKVTKAGEPFVVKYADFTSTKLIDAQEKFHPNVRIGEAKRMAQEAGLDLVCFNLPQNGSLALCKIINYGKWRYYNEKQKKKQNSTKEPKEIQFSLDIEDNDIAHKMKHANEFLEAGHEVTLIMTLKGRQRAHFPLAEEKMNKIKLMCTKGREINRKVNGGSIILKFIKGHPETTPTTPTPSIIQPRNYSS